MAWDGAKSQTRGFNQLASSTLTHGSLVTWIWFPGGRSNQASLLLMCSTASSTLLQLWFHAHHWMLLISACLKSGQQEKKQQNQGHAIESPKKTVVWSFRMDQYLLGDGKLNLGWGRKFVGTHRHRNIRNKTRDNCKIIRGRLCFRGASLLLWCSRHVILLYFRPWARQCLLPVIEYRMDLLLHDPARYTRNPKPLEGQATDDTAFTAMVWPALLKACNWCSSARRIFTFSRQRGIYEPQEGSLDWPLPKLFWEICPGMCNVQPRALGLSLTTNSEQFENIIMWRFPKMEYPQIIHFNGIIHEINHPAIGVPPL